MSIEDFAASLNNLLADVDPRQHVTSIKTAVAERLREADPEVRIDRTDYFNHTYAPDLVLAWGDERRRLYLRTTQRPDYLLEDLSVIAETHPIVMSLGDLPSEDERRDADEEAAADGAGNDRRQLGDVSLRTRTLVTDPSSLGALSERRQTAPVVQVFSRALLRGGRGLVDAPRAERAGLDLDVGWTSANSADSAGTSRAIETAESLLDPEQANQVTRLLQAAWIGSGAPVSTFPAAAGAFSLLDAENLRFLLDLDSVEDEEFWAGVGRDFRLEHLADLGTVAPTNANFQRLVSGALSRLRAHGCRVVDLDVAVEDDSTTRWFVQQGHLGLDHGRFRTYFALGRVADLPVPAADNQPVPLRTVLSRAAEADVELAEVAMLTNEGRQLDYRADGPTDIKNDAFFNRMSMAAGKGSTVRSVIALSGSKRMVCDLVGSTARGRTRAEFFVQELLRIAVPLFRALTTAEREALAGLRQAAVVTSESDAESDEAEPTDETRATVRDERDEQ